MKFVLLRPLLEVLAVLALVLGVARWVAGWFGKRTHTYRVTAARQLRLLAWPLLALGTGLSVVPALAKGPHGNASPLEWGLAAGLVAVALALGAPAAVLHLRYWVLNHETVLVLQPKENRLEVYQHGQRQYFERRDIARVQRVTCRTRATFWAPYNYVRLLLHDGREIVLTSLLADLEPLTVFLRSVPTDRRTVAWAWA
ncbi:hypothetical protein [Hymenobacter coccineus]|uniref:PH domain-containing protein n=1 Tax=Hymenobacter coccineus TaxID=1908235 RepID=A0A1G1TIJ9_9BACT|nr:hypothetical protein [Hymenobacter coccineus]OGX90703.1 hypothetical protein BEN49_21925 [Hymenobacter coccineus]